MLAISDKAIISRYSDIEDSKRTSVITISDGVFIDSFVKIKAAGGDGDIFIGENTYINSGTVLYVGNGIKIGRNVLIAANCTLAPVNHEYRSAHQLIVSQKFMTSKGGISIGDDVWIGANSVVLDGASIPDGCVIGAASVVKGKLRPYMIYAGNPLRIVGERN